MIQKADEHRPEREREYAVYEREHRGNFKGSSRKREGNHPDRGDQREHEQDRQKKEAEENEKRLEIAKSVDGPHAETPIIPSRQSPSAEESLGVGAYRMSS